MLPTRGVCVCGGGGGGGGRTRTFLITSRTRIQLSHQGRKDIVECNNE